MALIFRSQYSIWSATKRVLEQWWKVPSRWGKTRAIEQLHRRAGGNCAAASTGSHNGNSEKMRGSQTTMVPRIYEQQGRSCRGRLQPCAAAFPRHAAAIFWKPRNFFLMRECGSVVAFRCQHDPIIAAFQGRDHRMTEEAKPHSFDKW